MKRFILLALVLAFASGCASNATYTNYNTPQGNRVYATGDAATIAAGANTSHYGTGGGQSGSRNYSSNRNQPSPFMYVYDGAMRTVQSETSSQINNAIRQAFRSW